MARIRAIKPEFPQSETMGKLSRDARLLFVQLWTIVDDEGRTRAASRMLASLLYPYDDDARALIGGWLSELESHGCIRRYDVGGSAFLDIPNWLKHQKIDRPSPSKLPPFSANTREGSREIDADLGSGSGEEQNGASAPSSAEADHFDEMVAIYHEVGAGLWPKVQTHSAPRKAASRHRLKECGGLDGWRRAMQRARASPHLTGHNDRGWVADYDFFMQAKSFTKLLEGSYDARTPVTANHGGRAKSGHSTLYAAMGNFLAEVDGGDQREADVAADAHQGRDGVYLLPG